MSQWFTNWQLKSEVFSCCFLFVWGRGYRMYTPTNNHKQTHYFMYSVSNM